MSFITSHTTTANAAIDEVKDKGHTVLVTDGRAYRILRPANPNLLSHITDIPDSDPDLKPSHDHIRGRLRSAVHNQSGPFPMELARTILGILGYNGPEAESISEVARVLHLIPNISTADWGEVVQPIPLNDEASGQAPIAAPAPTAPSKPIRTGLMLSSRRS